MRVLISEKLSEHKYKTPEGYLICTDAILARTGKQTYTRDELFGDGDNTEVNVDRPYDQVMNEKTIASFENKPVTFDHPEEDVNVGNYKSYAVGYVRDVHQGKVDGKDVILGNLVITDQDAINAIESGEHTDLSCGYDCDIKDDGNGYYSQNNIRGNHVALCREGRAGMARIVDSKINDISWSWDDLETFIFKNYKDGPVHSEVDDDILDGFDSRLDATKLADFLEKKAHVNKTDIVRTRLGYGVKVYGVHDSKVRDKALIEGVTYTSKSGNKLTINKVYAGYSDVTGEPWVKIDYSFVTTDGKKGRSDCSAKDFHEMMNDSLKDSKVRDDLYSKVEKAMNQIPQEFDYDIKRDGNKVKVIAYSVSEVEDIMDAFSDMGFNCKYNTSKSFYIVDSKITDSDEWTIKNTGLAYEVWNGGKLIKKFPTKKLAIDWIQDRFPGDRIIEDSKPHTTLGDALKILNVVKSIKARDAAINGRKYDKARDLISKYHLNVKLRLVNPFARSAKEAVYEITGPDTEKLITLLGK